MLDIKLIRKNPNYVKEQLSRRDQSLTTLIDELLRIDLQYREALQSKEELEAERNKLSKEVGLKKSRKEDASLELDRLNQIKEALKEIMDIEPLLAEKQGKLLAIIPNLPSEDIPTGLDESSNLEIYRKGKIPEFDFAPKEHDELGLNLKIFDFERGVKIAKSRFTLLVGLGARLERALINFMLDKACQNGYSEIFPPIMANSESLFGVGQLPKFAQDLFKIEGEDLYMIPTAEVPLTNIFRDEILSEEILPISFCAYTPNFRAEAGAASRDTRGIIRQHQFNKIELVKICKAEDSKLAHEKLTQDAESILQALELPYRKVLLCSGDISASANKCYDLEVWFPGQNKYREISSCSNFADYQSRRAQIRYKKDSKTEFVHTINGSALAVGRTLAAILENYQEADSRIRLPKALRPYMDNLEYLT